MVGVSKKAERGTMEGGNQFSDLHASDGVPDGGREGGVATETGKTETSGLGHWVAPSAGGTGRS